MQMTTSFNGMHMLIAKSELEWPREYESSGNMKAHLDLAAVHADDMTAQLQGSHNVCARVAEQSQHGAVLSRQRLYQQPAELQGSLLRIHSAPISDSSLTAISMTLSSTAATILAAELRTQFHDI